MNGIEKAFEEWKAESYPSWVTPSDTRQHMHSAFCAGAEWQKESIARRVHTYLWQLNAFDDVAESILDEIDPSWRELGLRA